MRSALRTLVDTLRVICDLLTVSFVVLWIQNRPEFAPWVAASTLAGSVLTRVLKSRCFADSGETLAPTERDRKLAKAGRPAILARVKHDWVEGVLERSLYHVARIDLDMVDRPWNVLLHMPGQGERATDRGIKMSAVYDRMHGAFLILGEPGSGKTTMLLELARDVIARADTDPAAPIPVVLNLSSWRDDKQSFADWVIDELNVKYQIPEGVARLWIAGEKLLLLLDGLDEVKPGLQGACVQAINAFRHPHGLTPLVVCSRIQEYEALPTPLTLNGAILLQPLTDEQIEAWFGKAGGRLRAVRATLQHDAPLQELVRSPLMLNVMALAYDRMSHEELGQFDTIEARREHVFDTYVRRMFERRGVAQRFSQEQTIRWLAWLANRMSKHDHSLFLLERMQPDWLPTRGLRWAVIWGVAIAGGLLGGLLGGVVGGLVVGLGAGYLAYRKQIRLTETLSWSWKGLVSGLCNGLVFGLVRGLVLGLFGGLFVALSVGLFTGLAIGLFGGLFGGVVGGLVGGLFAGLGAGEMDLSTSPNSGIHRSVRNALVFGLFGGLVFGLIFGLVFEPFGGLFGGLFFGLVVGLKYGGCACLQHLVLRLLLWRNDFAPRDYVGFLDYAAERIFLRKVGGGYIFVHRLMLEWFAELWETGYRVSHN